MVAVSRNPPSHHQGLLSSGVERCRRFGRGRAAMERLYILVAMGTHRAAWASLLASSPLPKSQTGGGRSTALPAQQKLKRLAPWNSTRSGRSICTERNPPGPNRGLDSSGKPDRPSTSPPHVFDGFFRRSHRFWQFDNLFLAPLRQDPPFHRERWRGRELGFAAVTAELPDDGWPSRASWLVE